MEFEYFEQRVIELEAGVLSKLKIEWDQKDKLIELYEKELGDERVGRIQANVGVQSTELVIKKSEEPKVPDCDETGQSTSSVTNPEKAIVKGPSEWLTETYPKRNTYLPQIGDEVVYYRQGHEFYITEVQKKRVYDLSAKLRKKLPYVIFPNLEAAVPARVETLKFILHPPRLANLKLSVVDWETGEETGVTFHVFYHHMRSVGDFIILRQLHDKYIRQNWNPGDRFRWLTGRNWYMGTIKSVRPNDEGFPNSKLLGYEVVWDNKAEYMSPWELDMIPQSFQHPANGDPIPTSEEDSQIGIYKPSPLDWPPKGMQDTQCGKLSRLLEQVMALPISEQFLNPMDSNKYPEYASSVEYPMDLSIIKSRLDNKFYRRANAVQFDVGYIVMNAIAFNPPESKTVKNAKIIKDLCNELISSPDITDVYPSYDAIVSQNVKKAQKYSKKAFFL